MCGIVAYVGPKKTSAQIVFQGLKKLEYRGYDSWGVAVKPFKAKQLRIKKQRGKIGQAKLKLPQGNLAIGHTRWATHGGVTDANAHPHLDCQKKLAVIHNGIVENYQTLRQSLKNKGHLFRSETDTEVVAHLIEEKLKKQSLEKAVFSSFKNLIGSNAIAVLDLASEKIIACRDGSPLVVGLGKDEYFLASDVTPFLAYTKKALFLKDGEAVVLNKKGVKLYDFRTGKKKKYELKTIDWQIEDVQKAGYPHFFLKEIMEQKKTIPQIAFLNEKIIRKLALEIKKKKKIFLTGCGTAAYCALAAEYFFAQVGIEVSSYGAYEFLPFADFCDKNSFLIAISQSGETADTLIATKKAKARGAKIVAVVNAPGSTLERMADYVLAVGAGPEIAVVSTKAFTSQLSTLYLLSQATAGRFLSAQKQIKSCRSILARWLNKSLQSKVMNLAKKLKEHQDIYFIGKHLDYPGVLEAALKIKEASYLHSEAFASGELKHGMISLIQQGTPCLVLTNLEKETRREVLSSATELKSRGAKIIGISPLKAAEFDDYIKTPQLGDLTILGNVIVGQLLGYYLAIGRGCDPDKPRNLAKSVTVK
jgi:glucosamine--fructose-6-phosphate aminotransferase (isomerizing)